MPQVLDTVTIAVSESELAALVRERYAEQLGLDPEAMPIINFKTQAQVNIYKPGVEIQPNELDVNVRSFLVVLNKPVSAEAAASAEDNHAANAG